MEQVGRIIGNAECPPCLHQRGVVEHAIAVAIARARALFDKADMCAKTLAVYDEVVAPVPA